jgi:hypothetical protein
MALFCCAAMLLASAPGCGSSSAAKTSAVKGKVTTADGAPVKGASVAFGGTGSKAFQSTGSTGDDGSYTLSTFAENDGAPEGNYSVAISGENGPLTIVDGDTKVTVKPGANTFDFKVKAEAAAAAAEPAAP